MLAVATSAIAIAIGGGAAWLRRNRHERGLNALVDRESLSDVQIYKQFYAVGDFDEPEVRVLWNEVANTLRVPADKLRPRDRFGTDIGVGFITSEELDALGDSAAQRAREQGMQIDIASIATVDDYIKAFAARSA